jgi:LacI family transcriptional regulator
MTKDQVSAGRKPRKRAAGRAPVQLSDVARLAGVSTGTVSRVINQPHLVAHEATRAVRAAIDKLGWVPNGAARALATHRSRTIGVIIPNLANPAFAQMIASIQNSLLEQGYVLIIGFSEYDPQKALLETRSMVSRGIDGLVLLGENFDPALCTLLEVQKVPHLIIYSFRHSSERVFVGFDNELAARQLAAHLIDLGHRDLLVLAQETRNNDRALARLRGFLSELKARGIELGSDRIVEIPWSIAAGHQAFKGRLEAGIRPTAVLCSNDYIAAGALAACHEKGLQVPKDVSVVGFDDLEVSAFLHPPLTTVRVPSEEIGKAAAETLVDHLERKIPLYSTELAADIIVRSSTAAP